MSLYDSPLIDNSAKYCETSERRLRDVLNLESGFICRAENPDKGCDFLVELILNDKDSSSWRFPIQLKSVQKLNTVSNGAFISYNFPTSRLGYLLRHIPTAGIIVIYSIEENKSFFEFTDNIFDILTKTKDDDWHENDSVNIHIPCTNVLNVDSGKHIHSHFEEVFANYEKMRIANAAKYGLPSYDLSREFKYDFNNIEHLKKLLLDYGAVFLANYDLGIVYNAISRLTLQDIESERELLIISAVACGEVGRHLESELYLTKLKKKFALTESEETTIKYIQGKNKFQLGQISTQEFIELLECLKSNLTPSNQIIIRINSLRYKLMERSILTLHKQSLIDENESIFNSIEEFELNSRTKALFRVWNLENKSIIINNEFAFNLGTYKIKSDLGGDIPLQAKFEIITAHIEKEKKFLEELNDIFKNAVSESDKLLQAHSLSTRVTHFINQQFTYVSQDYENSKTHLPVEALSVIFSFSFNAYNLFSELELAKDANYCIGNCISILELSEHLHKEDVSSDIAKLTEIKRQLEIELDINPSDTPMKKLLNKLKRDQEDFSTRNWIALKNLDDEVLGHLARTSLEGLNLPEDRYLNLLNELKSYRLFHQINADEDIEILPMQPMSYLNDPYRTSMLFVLRNKINGKTSPPHHDVKGLLTLIPHLKAE